MVLELSSFQLEDIADLHYRFPVSVITSLFPDHLDRHGNFSSYAKIKSIIFKYQTPSDLLVVNGNDKNVRRIVKGARARTVFMRRGDFGRRAAYYIGKHFGVGVRKIELAIKNFRGLSGRLDKISEKSGVVFINDTTATNPTAAAYGVKTIRKRFSKKKYPALAVIAGGYDKKLPLKDFAITLKKHADLVVLLPGEASTNLFRQLQIRSTKSASQRLVRLRRKILNKPQISKSKNMNEAVRITYKFAEKNGGIVLLSPGAASFGVFKHEFDRGDKFVWAVKKIK